MMKSNQSPFTFCPSLALSFHFRLMSAESRIHLPRFHGKITRKISKIENIIQTEVRVLNRSTRNEWMRESYDIFWSTSVWQLRWTWPTVSDSTRAFTEAERNALNASFWHLALRCDTGVASGHYRLLVSGCCDGKMLNDLSDSYRLMNTGRFEYMQSVVIISRDEGNWISWR